MHILFCLCLSESDDLHGTALEMSAFHQDIIEDIERMLTLICSVGGSVKLLSFFGPLRLDCTLCHFGSPDVNGAARTASSMR